LVASEILRTKAIAARAVTGFSKDCCFVTFEPFGHSVDLDRTAFGENFLSSSRIDAVHILPAQNDWYQHADFLEACRRVAEVTRGYKRIVAYGSSMGGYAAIRFGGLVGAGSAFALSPQFSIDPRQVPFDRRWIEQARKLTFVSESVSSRFVPSAFIAYDPHGPDLRHADMFRPHTNVTDIALPNSGHPCTLYLAELGLLQAAVVDLAKGTFDPVAFRHRARRRRKEAPGFYVTLSRRASHRWHSDTLSLALAEKAIARPQAGLRCLTHFAVLAAHAGRMSDAFEALDRAASTEPHHPAVRRAQSEVLEVAGDLDLAVTILEGLCRDPIPTGSDETRLAHLRWRRRLPLYRQLTHPTALRRFGRLLDRARQRLGIHR